MDHGDSIKDNQILDINGFDIYCIYIYIYIYAWAYKNMNRQDILSSYNYRKLHNMYIIFKTLL